MGLVFPNQQIQAAKVEGSEGVAVEGETEAKEVMVEGLAMEGGKHTENFKAYEELDLEALNRESGVPLQCPPTPVGKRVQRDKH